MSKINRRHFLGQASCAAVGSTTFLSSLFNLHTINASAGYHHTQDFKALVCIMLAGGNDSFNMLIPRGISEYEQYQMTRSGLAIPQNQILTLDHSMNNGRELGLHPMIPGMQSLYNEGNMTFVANVGSLVEHTTLGSYNSGSALPLGLFSHVDEQAHWQTSTPNNRGNIGWGGRMADLLCTVNQNDNISMNLSMSGTNLFQTGVTVTPYSLSGAGSTGINGFGQSDLLNQIRQASLDSIMSQHYSNLYDRTYKDILLSSQKTHEVYASAMSNLDPIQTEFSNNNALSQNLKVVAQTIAIRESLGMSRQIYFVNYGGWDHHDEVLNIQARMLGILDQALTEFYQATIELGVEQSVTTFSISDFGRTLSSNGNGSDHAWGGNCFVMGGAVKGNQLYGSYPDLHLGSSLDVGRGRLIPTLAADEYFAELALWFGVPKSELDMVLPNIANFFDIQGSTPPIGFLLNTI